MEALFLYFGKMILCSAVMWTYYLLFLKDKSFHHYNRFYLLAILVISIVLPLLKVEYFTMETDSRILLLLTEISTSKIDIQEEVDYFTIGFSLVALVSFLFLLRLSWGLHQIQRIKNQYQKQEFQGIGFYQTDLHNAPFSFFKSLFWKKSIDIHSDMGKQILKHEMVHIEQKHSWDKLLVSAMTALFWFNPLFYFIKKEIHLIHEYLADKKAVKENDTRAFAQMLLASNFSGIPLPATSPFLSSNLKKRLQMLKNTKTKYSYARRIWALPLLFVLAFIYIVNAKNKEIKKFNQQISKVFDEKSSDSLKQGSASLSPLKDFNFEEKLKNATDKSLFIINGEEVSKGQMQNFIKNKGDKKFAMWYSDASMNDDEHRVFGDYEKYGVFSINELNQSKSSIAKYHQLIKEKNPKWYYDQIINKKYSKPEADIDTIKNPSAKKIAIGEAASAAKEAEKVAKSAELAARDAEIFAKATEKSAKEIEHNFNFNKSNKKSKSEIESELAEIKRKKAEIEKERAELWKKQSELMRKEIDLNIDKSFSENFSWSKKPNVNLIPKNNAEKFNNKILNEEIKIYINGVESNQKMEEINKMDTKTIESIRVYKKGHDGKTNDEIHITLKK